MDEYMSDTCTLSRMGEKAKSMKKTKKTLVRIVSGPRFESGASGVGNRSANYSLHVHIPSS
jgi:hypothetical protein